MAKKVKTIIKLQAPGGQAAPGQKLGPVLGAAGVNMMQFCTDFNAKTKDTPGLPVPVVLTVYEDRTFSMAFKKPPVAALIKKSINLTKGSGTPNKVKVGSISKAKVEEIAKAKMIDMNTKKLASAIRVVEGAAKSMGLEIK